jgi:hypothetical protein
MKSSVCKGERYRPDRERSVVMNQGMARPSKFVLVAALGVGSLFAPGAARADASSSEKAAAEALFDRGVALLRAHDYAQACPKLEASQKIEPAIGTLLYLGECYERLGRTASAWAMFREANSMARATGETDRAKLAGQRADKLEPELAYLEISVSSEGRSPELVVRRSGDPIKAEVYGVSIPVDPGEIKVEASAPGYTPYSATITVAPRDRRTLNIPALTPLPGGAGAAKPPPTAQTAKGEQTAVAEAWRPVPETTPSPGKARFLSYVFGGLGVAGIGVGSYFGIRALSKNNEAEDKYGCKDDTCQQPEGLELTKQAQDAATYSNIAFAAGGGALALGVLVFVLTAPDRESALVIAPSVARGGAGLSIRSRF